MLHEFFLCKTPFCRGQTRADRPCHGHNMLSLCSQSPLLTHSCQGHMCVPTWPFFLPPSREHRPQWVGLARCTGDPDRLPGSGVSAVSHYKSNILSRLYSVENTHTLPQGHTHRESHTQTQLHSCPVTQAFADTRAHIQADLHKHTLTDTALS